jgi:hypothetical protein
MLLGTVLPTVYLVFNLLLLIWSFCQSVLLVALNDRIMNNRLEVM